jgi:hypothetical protein
MEPRRIIISPISNISKLTFLVGWDLTLEFWDQKRNLNWKCRWYSQQHTDVIKLMGKQQRGDSSAYGNIKGFPGKKWRE